MTRAGNLGRETRVRLSDMMMSMVDITTWPDHLPESVRNCLTLASLS